MSDEKWNEATGRRFVVRFVSRLFVRLGDGPGAAAVHRASKATRARARLLRTSSLFPAVGVRLGRAPASNRFFSFSCIFHRFSTGQGHTKG